MATHDCPCHGTTGTIAASDQAPMAGRRRGTAALPPVVAAAEKFFQPHKHADEKIPAAHFLDLELGDAVLPVHPRDGSHCPRVAAHDGFEGEFDGEVEMGDRKSTRLN